jgi:hypothetical protein
VFREAIVAPMAPVDRWRNGASRTAALPGAVGQRGAEHSSRSAAHAHAASRGSTSELASEVTSDMSAQLVLCSLDLVLGSLPVLARG